MGKWFAKVKPTEKPEEIKGGEYWYDGQKFESPADIMELIMAIRLCEHHGYEVKKK